MKAAIVQSNYIPWKGYFDMIDQVDRFILLDDVQYTRRDWRNRNKIKGQAGLNWLTIPVNVKGKYHQMIRDVAISGSEWRTKHWTAIQHAYARAPCFSEYASEIRSIYETCASDRLSAVNLAFISRICHLLGIHTVISQSMDHNLVDGKSERLVGLCEAVGATTYLSGPAARGYLNLDAFESRGIAVEWMTYDRYREYPQLYDGFVHAVSVLDVMFNVGADAINYVRPRR